MHIALKPHHLKEISILLILTRKSPSVQAVFERQTLVFCTRVLCAHPEAGRGGGGGVFFLFFRKNVWFKVVETFQKSSLTKNQEKKKSSDR